MQTIPQSQVDAYQTRGYITVRELLSPQEVAVLNQATERVIAMDGPQVMRERNECPVEFRIEPAMRARCR